jgi:hypothetical protein
MIALKHLPRHAAVQPEDYNRLADSINKLLNMKVGGGLRLYKGGAAFKLHSTMPGAYEGSPPEQIIPEKVYEVLNAASGDGVYDCIECSMDATEWDDTAGDDKFDKVSRSITWAVDLVFYVGQICSYDSKYWACLTQHTAALGLEPDTSANWDRVYEWAKATANWDVGHGFYSVDDLVIYTVDSHHYRCILAHTAAAGKEPTNTNYWRRMYLEDDYVFKTIDGTDIYYQCTGDHDPADANEPPDITYWTAVNAIEVLNLFENDPIADYTAALGSYDRLLTWRLHDDEGNTRRVGIPMEPVVRRVKTTEAATANEQITCNLILRNGNEAASNELGSSIEVYVNISGGSALNAAVPRLADDDEMLAVNIAGKWWATNLFAASQDCP